MRLRILPFLAVLPLFLLAACANQLAVRQPLPGDARTGLTSTDVALPVRQSEIYVYVPPSTAGAQAGTQGGLIGALVGAAVDASVDSVRTKKAEAAVAPLRNSIVDFSFDNAFEREMKNSLSQVAWMHASAAKVLKDDASESLDKTLSSSSASAVLFVETDYRLTNDGDVFQASFSSWLSPNDDALRDLKAREVKQGKSGHVAAPDNALYRNTLTFEARVTATGDRDHNIAEWSANNGAPMRAALTLAAQKAALMLANDLERTDIDTPDSSSSWTGPKPIGADATTSCAAAVSMTECGPGGTTLVTRDADGAVLRFKDGSLKYVTNSVLQK